MTSEKIVDLPATRNYRISASAKGSWFSAEEVDLITAMLLSPDHLADGRACAAFEQSLEAYLGTGHVVVVSSCTMALELSTRFLNLGPSDTVIASPLTFRATTASLLDTACRIVWCDIDPDTLSMSPRHLEDLLNTHVDVSAIYVTHYGGDAARIDEIAVLARARGIAVVEDCAHGFGSTLDGRPLGTFGDFGCFSFHSLKNMSTLGTGGAIWTPSLEVASRLRASRHVQTLGNWQEAAITLSADDTMLPLPVGEGHEESSFTHECVEVMRGGLNAAMSDLAAAVGQIQLSNLPAFLQRRSGLADLITDGLHAIPGVTVLQPRKGVLHSHHLYTFLVETRDIRDRILRALEAGSVEVVQRYFPLHLLPEYRARGGAPGQCPTTESLWFSRLVNLPIHPWLTNDDISYMLGLVRDAATKTGASDTSST